VVTDPQTNTQTHPQTGPITIHCAAASMHCNSKLTYQNTQLTEDCHNGVCGQLDQNSL